MVGVSRNGFCICDFSMARFNGASGFSKNIQVFKEHQSDLSKVWIYWFSLMALQSYTQDGKKALEKPEVFLKNFLVGCFSMN